MKFRTEIEVPPSPWQIAYSDSIALLGSCFSDNIARKLNEYYFRILTAADKRPLYNPVSIAHHIDDSAYIDANVIIVTFGTSWVYIDKQTDTVVDNCLKRPASDFIRKRLTVEEIVALWQPILASHPGKRFIFTVSPIRHLKDGLHENNLSKAILLLAVERLTKASADSQVLYFPSYELLMDDLRDYRFYAEDLMHPSSVAVDYIWEHFVTTFMSPETQTEMKDLHALWLNRQHRPLHPGSDEDLAFRSMVEKQLASFQARYPWIK